MAGAHAVWIEQHGRQEAGGRYWLLLVSRRAGQPPPLTAMGRDQIIRSRLQLSSCLNRRRARPVIRLYRLRSSACARERHVCFKSFSCFHQQLALEDRIYCFQQFARGKGISVLKHYCLQSVELSYENQRQNLFSSQTPSTFRAFHTRPGRAKPVT